MSLCFILKDQSFYVKFLSFEKEKKSDNLKDLFYFEIIFWSFLI